MILRNITLFLLLFLFITTSIQAQMERQRAEVDEAINSFSEATLITQPTTYQLPARNLKSTIMHSFGIATEDAIRNFFGLDLVQNVRIGVDFGLTDNWSIGIGRSSLLNVVDVRSKYTFITQTVSGSNPFSLSLKGDIGVVTQENNMPFQDDLSTLAAILISRKFESYSLQLSPMYAHFNRALPGDVTNIFAIGAGAEIFLNERFSIIAEYYPVFGERPAGTDNAFSLGLNIITGGHVFQLFFTSTEWHLEQYVLANNDHQFWAGDFRFGFNINRVFGL